MDSKENTERLVQRLAENLFEAAFALKLIVAVKMEERAEAAREEPNEDSLVAENALVQTIDTLEELHDRQTSREGLGAEGLRWKRATKAIWLPKTAVITRRMLEHFTSCKQEPDLEHWRHTMFDIHCGGRGETARKLDLPEAATESLFHLAFVACSAGSLFLEPQAVEIGGAAYEIQREDRPLPTMRIKRHENKK